MNRARASLLARLWGRVPNGWRGGIMFLSYVTVAMAILPFLVGLFAGLKAGLVVAFCLVVAVTILAGIAQTAFNSGNINAGKPSELVFVFAGVGLGAVLGAFLGAGVGSVASGVLR